jgi:hypothetical protein
MEKEDEDEAAMLLLKYRFFCIWYNLPDLGNIPQPLAFF